MIKAVFLENLGTAIVRVIIVLLVR